MPDKQKEVVKSAVLDVISEAGRYPFLFVGSGLSIRYMGAPSWDGLLSHVCRTVLGDDLAFGRFKVSAKRAAREEGAGDDQGVIYPLLASMMEESIDEALLTSSDPVCDEFRKRHMEDLVSGDISPMKAFISDYLDEFELRSDEETEMLSSVGEGKISGVITTNYDTLCQRLFPRFHRFVGEREMIFSEPTFAQEIYQIHGSTSNPDSLVLTRGDYDAFVKHEQYLAAKLLTIFMEHPVVFLGYSLQDKNIRGILRSMSECVGPDRVDDIRRRMVFVEYAKGEPGVGEASFSFGSSSVSMTKVSTSDFRPVYEAIAECEHLYDPKMLRELKGHIFEISERLEPSSMIEVASFDTALEKLPPDRKILIGFATNVPGQIGMPISAVDLYMDTVFDDKDYPSNAVVAHIETLLAQNGGGLPMYKYIVGADQSLLGPRLSDAIRNKGTFQDLLGSNSKDKIKRYRKNHPGTRSLEALIEETTYPERFIWYLHEDEIDVDGLETFLRSQLCDDEGKPDPSKLEERKYKSEMKRCIRILDYLKYKQKDTPHLHPQ